MHKNHIVRAVRVLFLLVLVQVVDRVRRHARLPVPAVVLAVDAVHVLLLRNAPVAGAPGRGRGGRVQQTHRAPVGRAAVARVLRRRQRRRGPGVRRVLLRRVHVHLGPGAAVLGARPWPGRLPGRRHGGRQTDHARQPRAGHARGSHHQP